MDLKSIKKLHKNKYRMDIDGLRGLAIILVVVNHTFPNLLTGGYIGVDVFFVLSGYLITQIIVNDSLTNSFSFYNFYIRRIKRIFPALILVFIFLIIFGWYCLFSLEYKSLGKNIFFSTIFLENYYLYSQVSYFDISSALKPTLHLWSLAVEEQFYIFWPLIYIYFSRIKRINLTFSIIFTISLILSIIYVYKDPSFSYYSIATRYWELLIGCGLAIYEKQINKTINNKIFNLFPLFGILIILVCAIVFNNESRFPGTLALLPTIATASIIFFKKSYINKKIISNSLFVFLGVISYSLYLWHWVFVSFVNIIWGHVNIIRGLLCITIAIIMSTISFYWIEKPFRITHRKIYVFYLITAMMIVSILSILISSKAITPRLNELDYPTKNEWSFLLENFGEANPEMINVYKINKTKNNRILLIGDSHIAQYSNYIANKISLSDLGADFYIGGGCIPIPNVITNNIKRGKCPNLIKSAYDIAKSKHFHSVIIGGAWNWYFDKSSYSVNGLKIDKKVGMESALKKLFNTVIKIKKINPNIYILLDNPHSQKFNPASVKIRLFNGNNTFTPNSYINVNPKEIKINNLIKYYAKKYNINYIDPTQEICNSQKCKITDNNGLPIYKDEGHFNPDWTIKNATFLDVIFK